MRTLAIGDVHGCLDALEALLESVAPTSDDTLVMLGDYVDRGPHSKQVIDLLIRLSSELTLVPLIGNHEVMMRCAREDRTAIIQWCHYGGSATLDSYSAKTMNDIPEAHWQFLASCRRFHETEEHFFVHANALPDVLLSEQTDFTLFWEHLDQSQPHISGKHMVCGHTAQRTGLPLNLKHTICIDTAACGGGWLSCLDAASGTIWQANQKRETRSLLLADL